MITDEEFREILDDPGLLEEPARPPAPAWLAPILAGGRLEYGEPREK